MRRKPIIREATVYGAILCILSLLWFYSLCMRPNILVQKPSKSLNIPRGMCFSELESTLKQQGYIADLASFSFLARLMRYDRRIIPGAYRLESNMSNWRALWILRTGMQQPVKIVLHRARNKEELAVSITKNIAINAADFKKLLNDPDFVSQYGFNQENVLTMFIPNTYEVYWTITPEGLFKRMYKEYQRFWNNNRRNQAKRLQLSPIEVSILASLVQSETNKIEEAPLISGVYLNRLRKKMSLQSCPTLLYALGDRSVRRVLHKYQALDSPYNTYKHSGLPPGPIDLPTIAMLEAVLNSTANDYLYFVAKEDFSGYHYFAKSHKEHLRNAGRYHEALNQARVYR